MTIERSSSVDWYTDRLLDDMRIRMPTIVEELQQGHATGTLFEYDKIIAHDEIDLHISAEAYAWLTLVGVANDISLPQHNVYEQIHSRFGEALDRKRESSLGYAVFGDEAVYLFLTQGLRPAVEHLQTRSWYSPSVHINPRASAYETIVDYLLMENRAQEALEFIPFMKSDASFTFFRDRVWALAAYNWLSENHDIDVNTFRAQWVDRFVPDRFNENPFGRFVMEAFLHRELTSGRMEYDQARIICEDFGDPELIVGIESEAALNALQQTVISGRAEYNVFKAWVSPYIQSAFHRPSLGRIHDIDIERQTDLLLKVVSAHYQHDKQFTLDLLLDARDVAEEELRQNEWDYKVRTMMNDTDNERITYTFGSLLRVYETAVSVGELHLADEIEQTMRDHGILNTPSYCEIMALSWLDYDMKVARYWLDASSAHRDYFPNVYYLALAKRKHTYREVFTMAQQTGREIGWSFWRKFVEFAVQAGDDTWKIVFDRMPVIEKIMTIRNIVYAKKQQSMNLPRHTFLEYAIWGSEKWDY